MYRILFWLLIGWILLFHTVNKVKAEDVYIHHQNYGNTHSKWKNRLEAASHTVTSSTNIATNFSGIEQYYDLRYSSNSLPTDGLKTILSNGGTVILNGENTNFGTRNGQIQTFIRDVTSDNSITYSTSLNIDYSGNNEQLSTTTILTSLPNNWSYLNFAFGGVISNLGTNGKCLAANGQGRCGVALFDGDALDSSYSGGKVIIITDINYASHSQYYTNDNKEFLNALISDITTSTVNTRSVTLSGITSSQQTEVNTAKNKSQTNNAIYLTQSGDGIDLDIVQDGTDNLIIGSDLTNTGSIQGDNNAITLTQKNAGNVLGIDVNGNTNDVDIWQDTEQNAIVNITGNSNTLDLEQLHLSNSGEHFSKVTVNGNSNNMTIDQKETGDKILFLEVDSSNNVIVDQKGTGNHFLDVNLTDSHTVNVTQDGTGSHNATIHLSGNSSSVTLTQDSSTNQNYHLQQSCSSSSCSATVTQN
jgi:hypothetical protein